MISARRARGGARRGWVSRWGRAATRRACPPGSTSACSRPPHPAARPARVAGYGVVLSVTAAVPGAAGETVAVLDLPRDVVPQVAAASTAGRVSLAVIPAGR